MKLEFKPTEGNAPMHPCNGCGSVSKVMFTAEHPGDNEILIVACSEACVEKINASPYLEGYLNQIYSDVEKVKGGSYDA